MRPCLLLALVLGCATPAAAQVVPDAVRSVDLLAGWREPDGSRIAAIAIDLAPGWYTYWRIPGEAGIAPRFDWSRSRNLASVAAEWPRPEVFDLYGLESYGFYDELVLPLRLEPRDPAVPIEVDLALDFGVCDDICMPAAARVSAMIAPDAPDEGRARIEAALAERPANAVDAGVASVTCGLAPAGDGLELTAEVAFASAPGQNLVAIIESGQPELWVGRAVIRSEGRTISARAPVEALGAGPPILERRSVRMTLLDDDRAVEVRGCRPRAETASR